MEQNTILAQIKHLEPGDYFVPPMDVDPASRYNIACAPHQEIDNIEAIINARGGSCSKISVNGFFAGYAVTIPEPEEMMCMCQHSGQWGPWYHQSVYRRGADGAWIFVAKIGGHYSRSRARETGLHMGRPGPACNCDRCR